MSQSDSFESMESEWKAFLAAIERAWAKIELGGSLIGSKRFQPFLGRYASFRRSDQLLRYLKHARNADTHTLAESVSFTPQTVSVRPTAPGKPLLIRRLEVRGDSVHFDGDGTLAYSPPKIECLRVKDRGKWYNPPSEHMGLKLSRNDPIAVAEAGLTFYESTLADLTDEFLPPAV